MCTVTYIPPTENNSFILTSNRDEKMQRETIPPAVYLINDTKVCFPKDIKGGGSWIAANNKGRLCCLLNGAFVKHTKQPFHLQSRGKILLEMTTYSGNILNYFIEKNLADVEPFTLINIEQDSGNIKIMHEFIWDGIQKHNSELDINIPKIWSSATLYSQNHRELRNNWFKKFLADNINKINPQMVYDFHSGEHSSDQSVNLLMQRKGGLKTVSITQIVPAENNFLIKYSDILNFTIHQSKI